MERRPGLDLLRAIAIAWVIPFHSYIAGYMGGGVLRWSGWMGVDLFFALSGFLIGSQVFGALAARHRVDVVDFYVRRGFRTLPAYLVMLAIYVVWPSLREASGMMPVWQFLTYTLNLLIDPNRIAFSHAWSLCVEEQFYLVFPLLALLCMRQARWWFGLTVIATLVFGGIMLRVWIWMHCIQPLPLDSDAAGNAYLRFLYYPTYARMDDLLGGVVLAAARSYHARAWAWIERHANRVTVAGLLLTALCMGLFAGQARYGLFANALGYPVLALAMTAVVAGAASTRGTLARLHMPGADWIAAASYSLYLTHKMVYGQLHGHLSPWVDHHGLGSVLIYATAILAAGALLHYTIERPFLRLREPVRRMLAQRRSQSEIARVGVTP